MVCLAVSPLLPADNSHIFIKDSQAHIVGPHLALRMQDSHTSLHPGKSAPAPCCFTHCGPQYFPLLYTGFPRTGTLRHRNRQQPWAAAAASVLLPSPLPAELALEALLVPVGALPLPALHVRLHCPCRLASARSSRFGCP